MNRQPPAQGPAPAVRLRLVHEAAEGRDPAKVELGALFREHAGFVATIALRLMGRDSEVDDVVQEVFLEAVRKADTLDPARSLRGWLATVTVRTASRRLRRRKLRAWLGFERDAASIAEELVAPDADPAHRQTLLRLYAALDTIPTNERTAWILRHLEDEPLEVVAAQCECSLATIKRRISAAHAKLERALRDG